MKRASVLFLLLVTSIAAPRAQGTAPKMEGYPEPGAPAIVKLLSPGSAPRTALRFAIPASYKEHLDMTMEMSMSMEMGGNAMPAITVPTMTVGCDIAATGVAANGDVSYTMTFTGLTVASGADPNMVAAMQGFDSQIKTLSGTATVDNRGMTRALKMDLDKLSNPQMSQLMGQMSTQMKSLSVPLPEEEVGPGARWEVRQAMSNGGITMFQRFEYELATFDGKTATMNVKVEQTAPAQSVSNPALPPEADIRLLSMSGSGTGTTAVRLDSLLPTATANINSTMTMEISIGGNQQTMSTTTSIKMTGAPKKSGA